MDSARDVMDVRESHGKKLFSGLDAARSVVANEDKTRVPGHALQALENRLI